MLTPPSPATAPHAAARATLRLPVLADPANGAMLHAAVDVFLPNTPPRAVLYCLPGGGVNRQYFDLQGDGHSFAAAMLARGHIVVTIDHIGVGDSDEPQDRFQLTSVLLAQANASACRQVEAGLADGSLCPGLPAQPPLPSFGVGHSMGAMLTVLQHAADPMHAGLALLCFSTRGLPEYLSADAREAATGADGGRARAEEFARAFFQGDPRQQAPRQEPTTPASIALAPVQDKMLQTSALTSMLPNNVGPEAASITVPVLLALGERDIAGRPHRIPQAFPASRDIVLHINPQAGHHPFVGTARAMFFARIAEWLDSLLARAATTG